MPSPFELYESGRLRIRHRPLKRTFDLLFALGALSILAPLLLVIALLIRLTSRGPILYAQERVGRGGRPFRCYKFRTMHPDAEERLSHLLASNPKLQREWEQSHKLKEDPRTTRIGRLLRRYSLDELPQFWNVLRGDLSVVGPRPLVREEVVSHFGRKAVRTLCVRPGLTCLWQILGRSDLTYPERVALDEKYARSPSLLLDLKIIAKTIPALITSRGAY